MTDLLLWAGWNLLACGFSVARKQAGMASFNAFVAGACLSLAAWLAVHR